MLDLKCLYCIMTKMSFYTFKLRKLDICSLIILFSIGVKIKCDLFLIKAYSNKYFTTAK